MIRVLPHAPYIRVNLRNLWEADNVEESTSAPSPFLHVRPQLRILRLNVYRHSEDASCVNQAFGEDAQHAFMYLTHGRREEADDGKRKTSYQHPFE